MDLRRDIPKALRGTDEEGSRGLAEVVPTPGPAARQQRRRGAGRRGSPPARLPPEQAATAFTKLAKRLLSASGKGVLGKAVTGTPSNLAKQNWRLTPRVEQSSVIPAHEEQDWDPERGRCEEER